MKHEVREMLARMGILIELSQDELIERLYHDVYKRQIDIIEDLQNQIKSMGQEYRSLQQEAFFLDGSLVTKENDYVTEILAFLKEEYWEKFQEFLKEDEELRSNIPKKPFKVMGTGSRSMLTDPDAKEIYSNLEAEVLRLADKYDLHLISGMAEGWDEAIAKVAMRNGIPYTVMIPNKGYGEYYWGKNSLLKKSRMNVFNELVKHATKVVYVCDSIYEEIDGKKVHANFIRNQAMVDECHGALVYKPQSRGTRDAVERLEKANKPYKVAPFKK